MSEKKTTGWQNMRRQLDNRSKPVLIALVKDLHDASPDNRDFLLARFQAEEGAGAALENTGARSWNSSSLRAAMGNSN